MSSPPTIRKNLLQALEEKIIPIVVQQQKLHLVLAEPPMHLPVEVGVTHLSVPPLSEAGDDATKFGRRWMCERVNDFQYPYLGFIYEGEADIRVGVTQGVTQAARVKSPWTSSGCHILHLPAPSVVLFPPGVPYSDGSGIYWERDEPPPQRIKVLWVQLIPTGALCHLGSTEDGLHEVQTVLQIEDSSLSGITAVLQEELRLRARDYQAIVQSQLLTLLLRLRRSLLQGKQKIGNTVWLSEPETTADNREKKQGLGAEHILNQADEFIQLHLNEPLRLGQIAAYCGVSPTHLNRTFNTMLGISVKRYVNRQRIRVASRMLAESDTSIKIIARMTGFSQASHFCQAFSQAKSISPGRYRSQKAQNSAASPSNNIEKPT